VFTRVFVSRLFVYFYFRHRKECVHTVSARTQLYTLRLAYNELVLEFWSCPENRTTVCLARQRCTKRVWRSPRALNTRSLPSDNLAIVFQLGQVRRLGLSMMSAPLGAALRKKETVYTRCKDTKRPSRSRSSAKFHFFAGDKRIYYGLQKHTYTLCLTHCSEC